MDENENENENEEERSGGGNDEDEDEDEGIALLSRVEHGKARLLLCKVLAKCLSPRNEKIFSAKEEEKLESALRLTARQLRTMLDSVGRIFRTAAREATSVDRLRTKLARLGLDGEKTEIAAQLWAAELERMAERLRTSAAHRPQLQFAQWQLHLIMAHSTRCKVKQPVADIQFSLTNNNNNNNNNNKEVVNVHFDHESLYDFYSQLEEIQARVDSLR